MSDVVIGARRTSPEEGEDGAIELTGLGYLIDEAEAIRLRDDLTTAIDQPRLAARPGAEVVEVVGRYALTKTAYEWCVRETLNMGFEDRGEEPEYDYAWYRDEADARPVIEDERGRLSLLEKGRAARAFDKMRCISCKWSGLRGDLVPDPDPEQDPHCPNCGGGMLRETR